MDKFFLVSNLTRSDVESKKIRIVVENKKYLPGADNIEPKSYKIKVKIGSEVYDANYRVGNRRSGVLSLGSDVFKHKLGAEFGDVLKINVLEENKLYEIEKRTILR